MTKTILLFSALLALTGCSGGEFSTADTSFAPTAGTGSDAGANEGGEASSGGSDAVGATAGSGGSQGGSTSQGGSEAGGGSTQGGDSPLPMGGTAGSLMGGSAGTGGIDPDPICTPKATRCTGLKLEACSTDGTQWETEETCDSLCTPSGCTGDCKPGTNKCDGNNSMTCDEGGHWVKTSTCPFVCRGEGECKGSCVPGTASCSGKVPQTCNDDGELIDGTVCENLCSNGVCTGACTPGQKECNGNKSRVCQPNGTWKESSCSFVCSGAGICSGECVPGTKQCDGASIQTCNLQGKWETESSCPYVCQAGACAGICKPNYNCNDDGNDCTTEVCAPDGMSCQHPNKPDGVSCGSALNNECNKPDSCQAGICKSNYVTNGTPCATDSNACTVDSCNGSGQCGHQPGNAGTVCQASSCSNGQVTSEAKCNGTSAVCPAPTKSDCYGACDAGGLMCAAGQPIKMADSYTMLATDNDPTYLYASVRTDSGYAQVLRIKKSDNTQTVLYQDLSGTKWIYAIILAGNHLYLGETTWNNGAYTGNVTRVLTTLANQTPTFIQNVATFGFAKNTSKVYWSDAAFQACDCATPDTHHIYNTAINGDGTIGNFPLNFGSEDLSPDFEVTDTDLYVWEMTNHSAGLYKPSLFRYGLSNPLASNAGLIAGTFINNGVMVETRSTPADMPGVTKNGTYIFANVDTGSGTAVLSIKIANDAVTSLGINNAASPTSNFVADNQYVYIDNQKVSVTGGSFVYTSSHSIAGPSTLTLDSQYLYFGSYGYWTALPYTGGVDVPMNSVFKILK